MNYYQISSKSPNPETPDKLWFAEAQRTILCKVCNAPYLRGKGIDVTIQGRPDQSAINFVPGIFIGIAETSFLRALFREETSQYLYLGRVFASDRHLFSEKVTFIGRSHVVIRGGSKSTFRRCSECGRISYAPIGKRYVLRHEIGDMAVLDAWFGTLVVSEPIAERVIGGKWQNVVIQKLEVRDEPVDGLTVS